MNPRSETLSLLALAFGRVLAQLDERARAHARVTSEWRLALAYDDARTKVEELHSEVLSILEAEQKGVHINPEWIKAGPEAVIVFLTHPSVGCVHDWVWTYLPGENEEYRICKLCGARHPCDWSNQPTVREPMTYSVPSPKTCEACHGRGIGLDYRGDVVPCPMCKPEGT